MKAYIGIDPGSSSGCIAIIYLDDKGSINSIETIEFSQNTIKEWYNSLRNVKEKIGNCFGILEKVHGMPGMGVQSISAFMKNVGHIEMALISLDIPFIEITPQKWMKYYSMKREKDESKVEWKRRLRERVQRIFPEFHVKNDTADAILIAYYAAINF